MVSMHNQIHRKILHVVAIAMVQTVLILALFGLVMLGNELILPQLVIFGAMVLDTIMYIIESDGAVKGNIFKMLPTFKYIQVYSIEIKCYLGG